MYSLYFGIKHVIVYNENLVFGELSLHQLSADAVATAFYFFYMFFSFFRFVLLDGRLLVFVCRVLALFFIVDCFAIIHSPGAFSNRMSEYTNI